MICMDFFQVSSTAYSLPHLDCFCFPPRAVADGEGSMGAGGKAARASETRITYGGPCMKRGPWTVSGEKKCRRESKASCGRRDTSVVDLVPSLPTPAHCCRLGSTKEEGQGGNGRGTLVRRWWHLLLLPTAAARRRAAGEEIAGRRGGRDGAAAVAGQAVPPIATLADPHRGRARA